MIRTLILRKLDGVERELGESVDYLRHVVRNYLGAFFKFVKIMPLAQFRRELPADAYAVARIVATRDADCGPCTQIEINQAIKSGVSSSVLEAVINQKIGDLPPELANVYRFTESVVGHDQPDDSLRETIRKQYGERGLIELAFAIASCRVFPITKRALGFATSCSQVTLSTTRK